ncbi:hypothetical protein AALP_AA3G199100 [Arabis alpina]|uniref:Uncharacterized protein n=1 Tax=Arabis alpina TaxID=50452 RepID=A0A087HAD3_ARAAL|nr:hypothetical protein AALP_AA3G199100 [Arabis alpina]
MISWICSPPQSTYEGLHKKVNEETFPDLSDHLQDIIGNHYIFHIKVTMYNYSTTNRSFTVAKITNNGNDAKPTFSAVPSTNTLVTHEPYIPTNYNAPGPSFTIPAVEIDFPKRLHT